MKLTENFTLEELTKTNTGLKNIPYTEALNNLNKLAQVLQKIRDAYGQPIIVTSGYRSFEVNHKVGGASNSDHVFGAAADIKCKDNVRLWEIIRHLMVNKRIQLRQLIWEYGTKECPAWIHLSINHSQNRYKNNQILYIGVK